MKAKVFLAGLLFAVIFFYSLSYSQVPQMINYQGKVTDDEGNPLNGNYDMTFSIYEDSIGGTALWTETQVRVSVENGIFSVLLGSDTPIPFDVFNGDIRYLEVQVGSDVMTPRKPMVSVPYAFTSSFAPQPDGDWDYSTVSDVMYPCELTDKVGIGTNNPQTMLDVACPNDPESYMRFHTPSHANGVYLILNEHRNRNLLGLSAYDEWYGNYITTEDPEAGTGQGFVIMGGEDLAPFDRFVVNTDSMFLGYAKMAGDGSWLSNHGEGNLFVHGNVGIGTTEPAQRLDINGDIKASVFHGDIYQDLWSSQTLRVKANGGISFLADANDDDEYGAFRFYNNEEAEASMKMIITEAGDIGIGTANPQNKLDVEGGVAVGESYSGTNTAPANGMIIEGRVGIGTGNPTSKLHVKHVMRLHPQYGLPPFASDGELCVAGTYGNYHIYCYLNGAWRRLD